ncbi:MAG: PD-(D/E)XK nuclease-like domain-containing protein, partial [Bacteroidota bacterium]
MTIQQILNQESINSPSSKRIGFKELKKLRQLGFHTYPHRPLSYSSLKEFGKSPLHYIEYLTKPSVSSQAMIAGKLFEALLFEKDIETDFLVFEKPLPDKDFRNKENKQARSLAFLEAATNGKEVIESFEYQRILGIADQAQSHPFWKRVKKYAFKHPDKKTIIEPSTRLKLTGIPDLAFNRGKIGVDIKFVGSVAGFRKRIFGRTYAYWMQAAMYSLIFGFREFYFFA